VAIRKCVFSGLAHSVLLINRIRFIRSVYVHRFHSEYTKKFQRGGRKSEVDITDFNNTPTESPYVPIAVASLSAHFRLAFYLASGY
jgi:hypothetical protein